MPLDLRPLYEDLQGREPSGDGYAAIPVPGTPHRIGVRQDGALALLVRALPDGSRPPGKTSEHVALSHQIECRVELDDGTVVTDTLSHRTV